MKPRLAAALLLAVLVPAGGLAVALAVLAPFSLDRTGDLREVVAVSADGRVTIDGVGVGSTREELVASSLVGEDGVTWHHAVGDFGTTLLVMNGVTDGRVEQVALFYDGNPLALARLAARWSEALGGAGARCELGRCELAQGREPGAEFLSLSTLYRWYGPESVIVSLGRRR